MENNRNLTGIKIVNGYLDNLFESYLKGFNSKNARRIYEIMYKSEQKYLTTLDLQYKLKKYGINLNKKELNNWLNYLKDSNLVTKDEKRGKPTTIEYTDKYTFDLWKISDKGIEIGKLLPLFRNVISKSNTLDQKNVSEKKYNLTTSKPSKKIINIKAQNIVNVFKQLNKDEISFRELKNKLGIDDNEIINTVKNLKTDENRPLFNIYKPESNRIEKILKIFGLGKKDKWFISMNDKALR